MLLSHTHKFIFIKTLKTASTSVECFLEQFCRPPNYIVTERSDAAETEYGIVGARLFPLTQPRPRWFNHMHLTSIKNMLAENIWNSYYKITTIRNTFDKVVSWWWWEWRNNTIKRGMDWRTVVTDKSFDYIKDKFRKDLFSSVINLSDISVKDFITINGEFVIDKYIRYEYLQDDLKDLANTLSLTCDIHSLPKMKTEVRLHKEPYQSYYDKDSIDFVYDQLKWEIDYFNYTI